MAKDDYSVIVFKILAYLYACLKRKITFEKVTFNHAVKADVIHEDYLKDILRMMQNEGLIDGLIFQRAWGNEYFLMNDISGARITPKGIEYLMENESMKKVKQFLIDHVDTIVGLLKLVGLYFI